MSAPDITGASDRQYRRGAILGLTMAESFLLLAFAMLLMLGAWHVMTAARLAVLEPVLRLDRDRQAMLAAVAADPDLLVVMEAARGLPPSERGRLARDLPQTTDQVARLSQAAEDRWRFVSPELAERLIAGVTRLPEDEQLRLTDLVALNEPMAIARAVAAARDGAEVLSSISDSLGAAAAADQAMLLALERDLGGLVSAMGGTITEDGALVFPEGVLFEVGSALIRPEMTDMLQQVCPAWLRVLHEAGGRVAGARIEGHASSDWGDKTGRRAYLRNLILSQARAAAVLETCLTFLAEGSTLDDWATRHLLAIGYSSSRPILVGGTEDPELSRRVVFSVDLDRLRLLDEVRAEVTAAGQTDLHHIPAQGMHGSAGP